MDGRWKWRRHHRRRNTDCKRAKDTHSDEPELVPNIAQTNFFEGYRTAMEKWQLDTHLRSISTVPISLRGLPKIIESVFEFLRWNCGQAEQYFNDQNLIAWIKCLLTLAEMKAQNGFYGGELNDRVYAISRNSKFWLPYPVALYLQCIGTCQLNGQEVRPCLIEHRIKNASGALNYSISGLNAIIDECKSYRSNDDELVQVARELIQLPGFHWEENNSDNTVRIHPDSVSSYSPMYPTRSDWEILRSTSQSIWDAMRCHTYSKIQYMRPFCLEKINDSDSAFLKPVQAVRFPNLSGTDGEIQYYINHASMRAYLEKLAPALMLGFECGGVTVSPWRSSIEHCYKKGVGNTLYSLNALVRARNEELELENDLDLMKDYEIPLILKSIDSLPKISVLTVTRIPVSFRALPNLVDRVWHRYVKFRKLDDAKLKKLQFLKLVLIYAEIKLAHAQYGTPAFSSDHEVHRIQSLLSKFNLISSYSGYNVYLPYPIAMYLDHLGRFSIQNQTVVPQLIEHDIKEASGAINYSYTGLVTLMNACSEYQNVDADIMKVALANVGEEDLPYVKWEVDPTDPNRKRISPSTIEHWSIPSPEKLSSWRSVMSRELFWNRYETYVERHVDLATGQGSSTQAVRFSSPFKNDDDVYMNVNVNDENIKLASVFKFGYEHGGVLFSRFCTSRFRSLRTGRSVGQGIEYIFSMNEANRRLDYSDSDSSDY